jgi:hypothetical protein
LIQQAYLEGEKAGIPVWCEDEAGPYQAIPQPGPSWQPEGKAALQPHEYVRGGTAKMMTLFHPATGQVRAETVPQVTNAVLHPWLQRELAQIAPPINAPAITGCCLAPTAERAWSHWGYSAERIAEFTQDPAPEVRAALVLDNLAGHKSKPFVGSCIEQGIALLYTPLGGSWLNMAESVQRIIQRRSLDGQNPESGQEIMDWLKAGVRGWNADPTPFEWGGKRMARRQRARERRHSVGGSDACTRRPLARRRHAAPRHSVLKAYVHAK